MNTPASASTALVCSTPHSTSNPELSVDVTCDGQAVRVTLVDARPDVVFAFNGCSSQERNDLAGDSWTLGLRGALRTLRLAEEARFAEMGTKLFEELGARLGDHASQQQQRLEHALQAYFDPKDGRVFARIENFVAQGGELERTLAKALAPEDGQLAKTLDRVVGENSALLRRLNPTSSDGVIGAIEQALKRAVTANETALTKALDPLASGGPAARFLETLRKEVRQTEDDRSKQLTALTKSLDASDPQSAMSRLLRDAEAGQRAMMRAVNADDPTAPLGIVRASLTRTIEELAKAQRSELARMVEREEKHHLEILERFTRIEERKRANARSPGGGTTFEDAVTHAVTGLVHGAPITLEATGTAVGLTPSRKVGDLVLKFTEESKYAGCALVIEAKHDASYNVGRALKELELARQNRGATAGLFVMARTHAPPGFPRIARYGQSVLVVWDHEDDQLDAYLDAALLLALALVPFGRSTADVGDIQALNMIESRIMAELGRLDDFRKSAERIRAEAEKIEDGVRVGAKKLNVLLRDTKKTLRALNVKLVDPADEPIFLADGADAAE